MLYERIYSQCSFLLPPQQEFWVENKCLQWANGETECRIRWIFTRVVHRMARQYWHLYLQATVLASPPLSSSPWSSPWGKFNKSAKCSRCTLLQLQHLQPSEKGSEQKTNQKKVANVRTVDPEMKDGKDLLSRNWQELLVRDYRELNGHSRGNMYACWSLCTPTPMLWIISSFIDLKRVGPKT